VHSQPELPSKIRISWRADGSSPTINIFFRSRPTLTVNLPAAYKGLILWTPAPGTRMAATPRLQARISLAKRRKLV